MKTCKIISNAIISFMLIAGAASCGESNKPGDENEEEEICSCHDQEEDEFYLCLDQEEDFCSCLLNSYSGVRDPEKFVPVINEFQVMINEFLSGIPENLSGKQKIEELEKWLNEHTCVNAYIEHYSAVKTNPPTGEILIKFFVDRIIIGCYYMDVLWSNPMTVTRFHDLLFYEHENTEEPVEIPSVEYSLNETSCKWNHRNGTELIFINSNEDLENYVTCKEGSDYPAIDFTKQTLLLSYISDGSSILMNPVYLYRFSTGYVLNVDLLASASAVYRSWESAIVVDKLDDEIDVEIYFNYVNQ